MPVTRDPAPSSALPDGEDLSATRQAFCAALKAARERRGLKLTDISAATKVCPSYFSALERNDLRVWPKGLFRRSFFRGYASTIGLPVAELLEEFTRLFPENEGAPTATPATAPAPSSAPATAAGTAPAQEFRLALDASWGGSKVPFPIRVAAAVIDLFVVVLVAGVATWAASLQFVPAFASVALTYFTLATALFGESPASFCLSRRGHIMEAFESVFAPAREPAPRQGEIREERPWTTDARRVRPREQGPGLRVRFKVSS